MADEDAIKFLGNEMKSDEYEVRTKCAKQLQAIAKSVGPQRTREELVPLIGRKSRLATSPK
jgi:hypothetical protein